MCALGLVRSVPHQVRGLVLGVAAGPVAGCVTSLTDFPGRAVDRRRARSPMALVLRRFGSADCRAVRQGQGMYAIGDGAVAC